MKITVISLPVQNQDAALDFYTNILGFEVKHDIPLGGDNRWLTLVSKEDPTGPEILLEPSPVHFEPSKIYQKALFDAGLPYTQFSVEDIDAEFTRLLDLGVDFLMNPTEMGTVKVAVLNDTCGNYIQLVQLIEG